MTYSSLYRFFRSCAFCALLAAWFLSGPGPAHAQDKTANVPSWARQAIWYQIFPERFSNGDRSNDPKIIDMLGGWPYTFSEGWQIHPWTSDWHKLQPWEHATTEGFYGETGIRRYGGDLQGVIDRLDYLQELGVTAIYFNPVFESPSLHKYDTALYHHIDNNFGPDPEGDRALWELEDPADPATWRWSAADKLFLSLIDSLHARGMKVIIDGVFNHTGANFWAFRDVVEKQEKSAFKDWFIIKKWDDPTTEENEFDYQGWYGVRDLPEVREYGDNFARGYRQHIRAVVQRWMDPNGDGDPSDGIDGWRLDVAELVPIPFWTEFRSWVKEINPDAYLTGEVWWEDWQNNKIFNAAPWLGPQAFDAVMNYRFAVAVKHLVIDSNDRARAAENFRREIEQIRADYPEENFYVMQNLMDSHDVDRLASQIVNPDRWYDHYARPGQNDNYDPRKPTAEEWRKLRLIAGIQMTMPGAPMIYYGTEAGMWGGDDPDCRKPMVWPDSTYESERSHPIPGKTRPVDEVRFDADLFAWYQKLIALRKSRPVLSDGSLDFFLHGPSQRLVGYKRRLDDDHLIIVLNHESSVVRTALPNAVKGEKMLDLISGERIESSEIFLQPMQIRVLQREE